MATRAELRGRVTLDASPFRRSLARVRRESRRLAREIGPSFANAAQGIRRGAQAVVGAAALLGGVGIKKAFDLETLENQFVSLLGSTDAAAERMRELTEFAASTPFEIQGIAAANRSLEAVGMGGMDTLRLVGDAAAATGTEFVELSRIMQKAFAMNKAGVALGDVINQLNERALLSAESFAKLRAESAQGLSTPETMKILLSELGRFQGSMERLSRTGAGVFSTLKDNAGLALAEVAGEAAEASKVIMGELIAAIQELRDNGTLKRWGEAVGNAINGAIRNVRAMVAAFANLDENQRRILVNMAKNVGGFAVAWRLGLVQPILAMTGALVSRLLVLLSPKVLLAGLVGVPAFLTGLGIGKALEDTFDVSSIILKMAAFYQSVAKLQATALKTMADPFINFGKLVKEALTGGVSDETADLFLESINPIEAAKRIANAVPQIVRELNKGVEEINGVSGGGNGKTFAENLQAGMDEAFAIVPSQIEALRKRLADALKIEDNADALAALIEGFKAAKLEAGAVGDELNDLANNAANAGNQAAGVGDAAEKARRQASGFAEIFRGGIIKDKAVGAETAGGGRRLREIGGDARRQVQEAQWRKLGEALRMVDATKQQANQARQAAIAPQPQGQATPDQQFSLNGFFDQMRDWYGMMMQNAGGGMSIPKPAAVGNAMTDAKREASNQSRTTRDLLGVQQTALGYLDELRGNRIILGGFTA